MPKWEESELMAFPSPAHSSGTAPGSTPSASITAAAVPGPARTARHRSQPAPPGVTAQVARTDEGDHQREKLQFALAVALTRGDREREEVLRDQIAALGGYCEEPGT